MSRSNVPVRGELLRTVAEHFYPFVCQMSEQQIQDKREAEQNHRLSTLAMGEEFARRCLESQDLRVEFEAQEERQVLGVTSLKGDQLHGAETTKWLSQPSAGAAFLPDVAMPLLSTEGEHRKQLDALKVRREREVLSGKKRWILLMLHEIAMPADRRKKRPYHLCTLPRSELQQVQSQHDT